MGQVWPKNRLPDATKVSTQDAGKLAISPLFAVAVFGNHLIAIDEHRNLAKTIELQELRRLVRLGGEINLDRFDRRGDQRQEQRGPVGVAGHRVDVKLHGSLRIVEAGTSPAVKQD